MPDASRPLALVTGASSGIGEAFARALAARGYDLALTARRADRLQALADELAKAHAVETLVIPQDLAEFRAHEPILGAIAAQGRSVDLLVNNAGFSIPQSFVSVPWSRQEAFLMTLVVNACGLAYGVLPDMLARGGGRMINVSSLAAFSPGVAGHSLYPGAKSLMVTFSQALDAEYRARGLKVTAICPGYTDTGFPEATGMTSVMQTLPRRLFQTPETVAARAIAANDAGQVVVIPGWRNVLNARLMRLLPRAILMRASAKYHLED